MITVELIAALELREVYKNNPDMTKTLDADISKAIEELVEENTDLKDTLDEYVGA